MKWRIAGALVSVALMAGGAYLGVTHLHDKPQVNPLGYVGLVLFMFGCVLFYVMAGTRGQRGPGQ